MGFILNNENAQKVSPPETYRDGGERRFIVRSPDNVGSGLLVDPVVFIEIRSRYTAPHVKPEGWGAWVSWGDHCVTIEDARAMHDSEVEKNKSITPP